VPGLQGVEWKRTGSSSLGNTKGIFLPQTFSPHSRATCVSQGGESLYLRHRQLEAEEGETSQHKHQHRWPQQTEAFPSRDGPNLPVLGGRAEAMTPVPQATLSDPGWEHPPKQGSILPVFFPSYLLLEQVR
jgi:hypothetical protein